MRKTRHTSVTCTHFQMRFLGDCQSLMRLTCIKWLVFIKVMHLVKWAVGSKSFSGQVTPLAKCCIFETRTIWPFWRSDDYLRNSMSKKIYFLRFKTLLAFQSSIIVTIWSWLHKNAKQIHESRNEEWPPLTPIGHTSFGISFPLTL